MRDQIMSEQYFTEFIAEENARIQRFRTKLESGEIKADRIFSVEQRINSLKFSVLIANYSAGADLERLRSDFDEILDEFPRFWTKTSSYINLVWMMSIAIMFDVEREKFSRLSALPEQYGRHDALLDFFSSYKLRGVISLNNHHFSCPVPYAALEEVIENDRDRPGLLKSYVDHKWYHGHKKFGITETHKSKEKVYSGYWSFESGALAKILNIDDSGLKESAYYPYDLAHFC